MESNQRFGSLLNPTSGSTPAAPPSGTGFGSLLRVPEQRPEPPATQAGPIDDTAIGAVAEREGLTPAQRRVMTALLAQESGSGRNTATSTDGARGAGQIMPATFQRYAKPGESIDNTDHNLAVMARIVKDLGTKFGDDPAKIATGYFSGEGNVGKDSAWKNDRADGNGKRVSSYVSDVLGRMGGVTEAKASTAEALPDLAKIPKWGQIAAGKKFQALSGEEQITLKGKYFDEVIAPHAKAAGADVAQERQKFLAKDAPPTQAELDAASKAAFGIYPKQRMTPREQPKQSVLEGQDMTPPDLPTTSRVPVKPEVRQAFNAKWDSSTAQERDAMAQRSDWVGMLARERAGVFDRYDQGKEVPGVGRVSTVADKFDTRAEARTSRLISEGVDPRFAEAPGRMGAAAGVMPGKEMAYLDRRTGTIGESDFDFETQALFDPNQPNNGLNNPLSRGLAKAGLGIGKAVTGLAQFEAEVLGMDGVAKSTQDAGKWLRNKEGAIGERGDFMTRNLEGAVNSIAQQLPLMIGGVKLASQAIPLAGMALQSFGQEYSDGRARGQSVGDATTRAGLFAAFEVIGEKFGLGETLKAYKAAAQGLPADQIAGFLWAALKKEVPGEVLTTTGQFATDKFGPAGVALNPNATGADYLKQVADTIAQTLMQSGLTAGGTTGVSKAVQFLNAPKMPEDEFARALQQEVDGTQFSREAINEQVVRSMNPDGTLTMPVERQDYGRPAPITPQPGNQPAQGAAPITPGSSPAAQVIDSITPDQNATNDDDVRALAESRLEMLRAKLAGDDDTDQATGSLTPAQQEELTQLEAAGDDVAKLRRIYGLDQPATENPNETRPQAQGLGSAQPAGQEEASAPAAAATGVQQGQVSEDPLYQQAVDVVMNGGKASVSAVQRQLRIGYNRAARLLEDMEKAGVVSPIGTDGLRTIIESEADREARLEREAIQNEGNLPATEPEDDSDIPFDVPTKQGQPTAKEYLQQVKDAQEQAVLESSKPGNRIKVNPATDKVLGTNSSGNQIYETPDGLRYQMRDGRARTGGDLAPVEDVPTKQEQTANVPEPQELGAQAGQEAGSQGQAQGDQVAPAFTRKEIPAMSDEELVEAQAYYSDRGHKRAAKIEREINKRAKLKQEANGTQAPQAEQAEAQGPAQQPATEAVDLTEINAQMPPGYEARDEGTSLALYKDGQRTDLHGLSRINGAGELLRQAKMRAAQQPSESPAINEFINGQRQQPPTLEEVQAEQSQQPAPTGGAPEAGPGESQAPQAAPDALDAELQDALAHLGDVLSDVFQPKAGIMPNQYGAGDLLPALSKVVELLVRKGFKKFSEATAQAAKAMRGNEKTAPFVDQISPRQWKAAYNAVAEFHEGTDTEEAVAALSTEEVQALTGGRKVEETSTGNDEPAAWPSDIETGDSLDVEAYRARKFGSDDSQGTQYGTFYAETEDGTSGYGGSATEVIKERVKANNVLVADSKRDALEQLFGKNSDEVGRWADAADNAEEDAERVADEMIGPEALAQGYDAIVYPNDTDLYGNPTRSVHYVGNIKRKPKTEKEAQEQRQEQVAPADLYTPEGKFKVAQTLADEFIGGASFKTIVEARKRIGDLIGKKIETGTELAKQADETIEVAVVLAGREIVQAGRKQGRSPQIIFDRLVDLYNRQPTLGVRSSTSVREQAYSTPVPLAYVASELAGVTYDTKMLEPTAGNGMLAIGASVDNTTVNELNPKRAAMLSAMGFKPTTFNAASRKDELAPAKSQQAVVANPPFGRTKDEDGASIIYEVLPNYGTGEIDHAIAFRALDTLQDDGRAVLIVGGSNALTDSGRQEDYRGKGKRTFYFNLYRDYNVVDHFTVDGSLYSKQGASYPVDVIVIEGRGKSQRDLPAADLPKIITSYDELKEKLNGTRRMVPEGDVRTDRTDGGQDQPGQGDGAGLGGSPGGSGAGTGDAGSRQPSVSVRTGRGGGTGSGRGSRTGDGAAKPQPADTTQPSDAGEAPVPGDGGRTDTGSQGRNEPVVDGLGGNSVVTGERVESGLTDRRGEEQETAGQVAYTPHSQAASVGTLVPAAMRDAIEASLQKMEDQFGSLDDYVAERLNMDPETVRTNFSAEQVDALALAIKNAEEGRGFIIGDQTGIGKGRVVAAMIRYALVNDKVPIFVTEKPNLYADMIRDLDDIGMTDELALDTAKPRILITNSSESIPYSILRTVNGEPVETNLTLRAPKSGAAMNKLMTEMMQGESLGEYKVIFTTYSQLQTVKGKVTDRMKFVQQFGAGNYMIFDESHNAGGAGETQARTKEQREKAAAGESLVEGRAAFVRQLVNAAYGTFFSSATYAKRPDVMDLYSSTNMKLAVDRLSQLGEAIKNGGVPMQQVVANMLTTDGQYIRRERTFAGVSYDTVETKVDKQTAENMASAMRAILAFSRAKEKVINAIQAEMDKEGAMIREMGGSKTSIEGANFGAIMHNLIDQMLLSLKAQDSVRHAVERLQAGEKVVLTVSNTMGSFLQDYAEEMGLNIGDPVALSFADLYQRYLEKQRWVTIKDGNGQKTKRRLSDEELGPGLVQMFNGIAQQIRESGFGSAPISPIDFLHNELRTLGYKTDEITGRTATLSYQGGTPKLTSRSANIKQRVNAVRGFNNGDVDVLILNQAGSTGLSLHASSKFKDQRKRHMIIVQAEKNIDTHMQMLGRVHRTGQIIAPAYSQMMADVPAEMRPAAVLLKKMASLNANTTASRKSSVTAEGVVDFMNDYGGQVVQEFLSDNPDVQEAIGGTKIIKLDEDSADATEDDIRKFTGYVPILPIKQQEEIYRDLIDRYNELLERENSMGTNKLEAKAVDLDAETLSSRPITEEKGDPSIFASPANMEQVNVKRTVKPFSSKEVLDMVDERLGGQTAEQVTTEQKKDLLERAQKFAQERIAKLQAEKDADPVKIEAQKNQLNLIYANTKTILDTYYIGQSISIADKTGMIVYGVITDIKPAKRTANPAAGSDWKVQIALANGDAKSLSITFSQIGSKFTLKQESRVNWYNGETQQAEMMPVLSIFDKGTTSRREKRWMVTGNILAGYAKYQGQIISYTRKDGTTGQGVLMSRQFDFEKEQKNQPVRVKTGLDAVKFIDGYQATIGLADGRMRIFRQGATFKFVVPSSKKEGGTFFLDRELIKLIGEDFYKRGSTMSAGLYYADDAAKVIDYLINVRQEPLVAITHADKLKEMMAAKSGQRFADLRATPSYAFAGVPEAKRVNARDKLNKLEKKLDDGQITEAEYVLAVREITRAMNDQSEERAYKAVVTGRRRGADWIVAQMMRGVADGLVPRRQAEFAKWLLDQNPNIANDLGYSITRKDGENARGDYNPMSQVMRLFSNNLDEDGDTAVHEILHHTERMMPTAVQEGVLAAWQRAWDATFKKATPELKAAMQDMLLSAFGDKKAGERVGKAFSDGVLQYDQHYKLYSPSEFWAVNATRILSNRFDASGSWAKRAIQWFKEFVQRVKGMLGLRSDAPILKAIDRMMKGDGSFVSREMLVNVDYSQWLNEKEMEQRGNDAPVRDIIGNVQRNATQFFGNRQNLRTFSAYDRSLSTQFNKALKDEHYGKVFALVNAMQNEVSLTSVRPAELAPGILRKVDDFLPAIKTLVRGADRNKSLKGATNALMAGTLAGGNVLEGRVWTEEELRNNFQLDDAGVALYQQARAAIDASLDEIAAAEAYAMAQGYVPKQSRRIIIDKPQSANRVIFGAIRTARKLLETALQNARNQQASDERIAYLEEAIQGYNDTEERVSAIFAKARDLKNAGYAPLMRFGKFHVGVEQVDQQGNVIRGEDGSPSTLSYQMFETMAEAAEAKRKLEIEYAGQDVRIYAGPHSNESHKLYSGISPETLALFAEEVGADKALKELYKNALSERSALKRRLERKAVAGYSEDLPRILANFITSNGRFAAQRYYMRDLNNAIKFIPKRTKGDVLDEAIKLKEHIMNPNDPAAPVSAAMFAWFLGGSVASALVNLSQPVLMTGPYLTQFGFGTASKALAKALPIALGRKQITDKDLRAALKRASQEGIVEAQEIFHLYSQGAQGVSAQLANALSKIPFAGEKLKAGTEGVRARAEAFFTLWGMMFSVAESFNRKLTFLAAWDVAMQTRDRNPYAFAVRAVNETQGIYNKANRPNWARGPVGRTVLTFKQFSLMYVELLRRMWKAGPEGKRAALVMLGMLMLAAGEEGLPFTQDLDDLIDTIGQWMGYDTNMKRSKRRMAHELLGEQLGDLFLYGVSSVLPLDFSGRLGLGNLIPGSAMFKKAAEGNKLREVTEVVGPAGSLVQQINDAYEAATEGNARKALENAAPKAVKDAMAGAKMATSGYATDTKGRKNMDVTLADAAIKAVGFNPTKLAEASRARGPVMQDRALVKNVEAGIVDTWARGIAMKDPDLMKQAEQKLKDWNAKNPDTPIVVRAEQIRAAARQYLTDQDTRILKSVPRELRGRAGLDLAN